MAKPTNPAVLLAWGDDLLLIEEAVDALAQQLAAGGMGAPDRVRLKAEGRGSGDGAVVLSNLAQKLGTGGLFGGGSLMVVAGAGRLARTKELRAGVASALANIAPGNAVALVDQRARRPNLRGARPDGPGELGLLVQDVGGSVLSCISPGPGELASWILQRAQAAGREIAGDAAKDIAERLGAEVREPDLDRSGMRMTAAIELEKLMLAMPTGTIPLKAVQLLVADRGVGSLFALQMRLWRAVAHLPHGTLVARSVSLGRWWWRRSTARCATLHKFMVRSLKRGSQSVRWRESSTCTSSPLGSSPTRRVAGALGRSPMRSLAL